jgi:hypothetical protein
MMNGILKLVIRTIIYDVSHILVEYSSATSQVREVSECSIVFYQQQIVITPTHWGNRWKVIDPLHVIKISIHASFLSGNIPHFISEQ